MSEELLYNEVLGITNDFVTPAIVKYMKKNLNITNSRYREQIFASPLALRYIEVPLYRSHHTYFCGRAGEIAHHLHSFRFLSENCGEF